MLILIKFLTWMASPTGIFTWGLLLALVLALLKRRKSAATLAALAVLQLVTFASAFVSDGLLGGLENRARALESENERVARLLNAQTYAAIVVLGGATGPAYPPKRMHPDLNDASDRIWHGARLYHQGLAPRIIVSGGKGPGLEHRSDIGSEAEAMRQLLTDLGIPAKAIVLEASSRTTRENAEFIKTLAAQGRIALVTSAFHMPRSYATFKKAGVPLDAFPTDFRVVPETDPGWARWLPKAEYLLRSEMALKEYLALAIRY
jgi:uncharacterized SAM-binding protein YcdF (DUF218 family)